MKRTLLLLLGVVAFGGLSGWAAAKATLAARETARQKQAESEHLQEAQRVKKRLAELVKTAERITVETSDDLKVAARGESGISFHNDPWQLEFARGLEAGSYVRTALPLGLFPPLVHVFKDGKEVLFYQGSGLILCGELTADGALQLDPRTAHEIHRLLLSKLPDPM